MLKHAEHCAANAGVVGLTRAVARELFAHGITCNAFSPFARTRAAFEFVAYDMAVDEKESPWTVEELKELAPRALFMNYHSIAEPE